MFGAPLNQSIYVGRNRVWWRRFHVLKNDIEDRTSLLGQIGHKRTELPVEIAKKEQRLFTQHRKARIVNPANRILRLEKFGHQRQKLLRDCLRILRRFQGKAKRKMILAHILSFLDWCFY